MQEATYTHVAFADESNWNHGRFRSLSLVSATVKNARALHRELDIIRQEHNAKEFKWTNTKWRHGIALADFFFQRCDRMRVDVLIWDIEDSRHKNVYRRDDKANFARMYYHLLHNVLKKRWSDGACWRIYPDEQKEVDWLKLEECLGWQSWAFEENLFTRMDPASGLRQFYDINEFSCVSSIKFLLIQLADMFAGLAAYSYSAFDKYQQWKRDQDTAPDLFDSDGVSIEKLTFSKSDKERLPVLHHVREEAGRRNFQVSLDSSNGLSTKNPAKHRRHRDALHPEPWLRRHDLQEFFSSLFIPEPSPPSSVRLRIQAGPICCSSRIALYLKCLAVDAVGKDTPDRRAGDGGSK